MSTELLVMRHAKSDWTDGHPDFERPLNRRGKRAAPRMGRWLNEEGLVPDRVVASPAQRVVETVAGLAEACPISTVDTVWDRRIYEASLSTLLDVLLERSGGTRRLLLVGHNPGLEQLVAHLGEGAAGAQAVTAFPTAAVALFDVPDGWDLREPGSANLVRLVRPRELAD